MFSWKSSIIFTVQSNPIWHTFQDLITRKSQDLLIHHKNKPQGRVHLPSPGKKTGIPVILMSTDMHPLRSYTVTHKTSTEQEMLDRLLCRPVTVSRKTGISPSATESNNVCLLFINDWMLQETEGCKNK